MHYLDTQKTPQFLVDAFHPEIKTLPVADWWSVDRIANWDILHDTTPNGYWKGNIVEIKIGPDFGIHTEPLERFQDELCRMRQWQIKNPHVDLHAVWVPMRNISNHERDLWEDLCHQYHVWSHVIHDIFNWKAEKELIKFLKRLDQPQSYVRDQVYMKPIHESSWLAEMFRSMSPRVRVSSDLANRLGERFKGEPISKWFDDEAFLRGQFKIKIYETVGYKKNGEPKKLALDIIGLLEDGE